MSMQVIFQTRELVYRPDDVFKSHGAIDFNQNGEVDTVLLGDTERYLEPTLDGRALEDLARSLRTDRLSEQDLEQANLSPALVERTDRGTYVEYRSQKVALSSLPEMEGVMAEAERVQSELAGEFEFTGPMQVGIHVSPFGSRLEVYRDVSQYQGQPT